jgi:hypothetical protein
MLEILSSVEISTLNLAVQSFHLLLFMLYLLEFTEEVLVPVILVYSLFALP